MTTDLSRELGRLLRVAQADRLPGMAAALARGGEMVWHDAVGVADAASGERMASGHQHRIGSITKTFTAAAVMQLRDENLLGLDDPLSAHLDGVTSAATIRRLLSHLAGIQREPPGTVWETLDFPTGQELVAALEHAEQVLAPGRRWHYSNLAFALLGEIVERRSGTAYERYVQERILDPLGLDRTGFVPSAPVATPYAVDPYADVVHVEASLNESGNLGAAGALWSTVRDLCRWGSFLADPDPAVLASETVAEMAEVQAMIDPDSWKVAWGLGLELVRFDDLILVGHEGAMPGFLATVLASRKHSIAAAVLTNTGNRGSPVELATKLIVKALEVEPVDSEEWAPGEAPPPEIAGILGRWWSEGAEFTLSYRAGRLEARKASDPPAREPAWFTREGPDRYRTSFGDERGELLTIVRDDAGEPVKLYWATYPCTRVFRTFADTES